jgi:IMP dehydrogenase
VTVPVGTSLEKAEETLHKHRIEKLLVVDKKGSLKGLITIKDVNKRIKFPTPARTTGVAFGWARRLESRKTPKRRAEAW